MILLQGCGIPEEKDISNNIDKGMEKMDESAFDESWDHAKSIEDYLHLIHYKYNKKDIKEMDNHLKKLDYSSVVMDKKKSEKEWKTVKKIWEKMKQNKK